MKTMRSKAYKAVPMASLVAGLALAAATASTAQDIDSIGGGTNQNFCSITSGSGSQTFGQTFTAGAARPGVQSFVFEMNDTPTSLVFRGEVYAWDETNARVVGEPLYTSGPVSTTSTARQVLTFTPASVVPLTSGQQYIVTITTLRDSGTGSGCATYQDTDPIVGSNQYSYANTPADLATPSWGNNPSFIDLGVRVVFAAAPDPAPVPTMAEWAMILFGTILAGGAALYIQRRRFTI